MITLGKFQIPASICRMLAAIKLILQFKTTNVIKDKLLYWPGVLTALQKMEMITV